MSESVLTFRLLGLDAGASRAIGNVGRAAEAASLKSVNAADRHAAAVAKIGRAFNAVGKVSAAVTLAVAYEGVKMATSFESAMARVHSQAGAPAKDIKALGDEVLKLSPKVGVGPVELADSLYHVESAGFRGTKSVMAMVEASAKLSKIGHADIGMSTQAIIGVMASGIKGIKDANDAAALLNTTVGIGDMKLPQLVKAIGTDILPTAKAVGLSAQDIAAAFATISDNATPVDQVANRLKTSLLTLIKPSKQQVAAFNEIGMGGLDLANDFQKPNGLLVAVKDLKKHLDATYPPSQTAKLSLQQVQAASKAYYTDLVSHGTNVKDATKLTDAYAKSIKNGGSAAVLAANVTARALGGSKTAGIFLTLGGETERLTDKYNELGTSASRAAKFQDAWATQQGTYKQQVDQLKAAWDVFLVKVGNAIIPSLKNIVTWLSKHPGVIKDAAVAVGIFAAAWTAVKIGNILSGLGSMVTALGRVGRAARTALTGNAIAGIGGARAVGGKAAADSILAEEAAMAGVATNTRGVQSAARDSEVAVGRMGTSFAKSGLIAGGVVGLGLAGIAGAIHEIMNDSIKGLPYVDKLASAIGKGGLSGAPARNVVADALSKVGTGNERGESIGAYLQRTTTSPEAGQFAHMGGLDSSVKDVGANMKSFFAVIQTGSRQAFEQFLSNYDMLQRALKASPATIGTVDRYLQALFDRYNTGRDAVDRVTASEKKYLQALYDGRVAASANSTDVAKLSQTYGISAQAAQNLARENKQYAYDLSVVGGQINQLNPTLQGNTESARLNKQAIEQAAQEVSVHAQRVLDQTGSVRGANAVFQAGIGAIENNAAAVGANKGQVDQYITSLGLIPPHESTKVDLDAFAAQQAISNYLTAIGQIPQNVITTVTAIYGSVDPLSANDPRVTGHHAGGGVARKGWSWIGERGPELVNFGSDSRVLTNKDSMAAVGGGGGGDVYVTINAGSVDQGWLRSGGAKLIGQEVARATKNGVRFN